MRAMRATPRFDVRDAGRWAPRPRRGGPRWLIATLLLAIWASFASAEGFAVPSFPGREGVDPVVAERFVEELRSALAERGVRVTRAPLVTAGIAGSLEPGFGQLVAQIEGTRYAVLGEILARETGEGAYAVDVIAVDTVGGRTSDLVSRAFGLATLEAAAVEVAILLVDFTVPTQALPPGDAALFVSTDPNGAEVRIDGVRIGTSGALDLLGLAPGRYEVEVRLEGYLPEIRTLDLRGAETHFLHVVLTEITGGSLQVVSRPGAEVWLDGRPAGTTPATLTTRPGDHEVELRRPGFVARSFTVPVRSFRVTRVDVELEPLGEPLLVWPTDAVVRVLVDGELRRGGFALIRPGLQTIEVLQGGEVRRWWRVVPEAGVFELDLATGALVPLPR
jgi:hypothetical protein